MSNVLVLDQLSKSSATNPQPRKRIGAQTTLAFATAAAAFFAMAGTAQAQDCVNGYRMVKDEIPVACSIGHFGRALDTRPARAQVPIEPRCSIPSSDASHTTANGWRSFCGATTSDGP